MLPLENGDQFFHLAMWEDSEGGFAPPVFFLLTNEGGKMLTNEGEDILLNEAV